MQRLITLIAMCLTVLVAIGCDDDKEVYTATLHLSVHPGTPQERQVLSGTTLHWFTHFKMEALENSVRVTSIRVFNADDCSDDALQNVYLYESSTLTLLATATITNRYVTFDVLDIVIPKDGSVVLRVGADIKDATTRSSVSGLAPRFVIENVANDVTAVLADKDGNVTITGDAGTQSVGYTVPTETLARAQHIVTAKLNVAIGIGCPLGNHGSAYGAGTLVTIFEATITVMGDMSAPNPQEVLFEEFRFTITGDVEVDNLELYWSEDNYASPISTSAYQHRTTTYQGDPADPADKCVIMGSTTMPVWQSTPYGTTVTIRLCGWVYALTSNDAPVRTLRVSFDHLGGPNSLGDIRYRDNGYWGRSISWVDLPGMDSLYPSSPLCFSTSTTYIN